MADVIDAVIKAEGGATITDDPADPGGRTQYGIAERDHPEAWADDKVTLAEARTIYSKEYIEDPGFDQIPNPHLRDQVIDFGVNAGPRQATKTLQSAVGVWQDGALGPHTLAALKRCPPKTLNNTYVVLRETFYRSLAARRPSQRKFLKGWLRRAHSFYLP